MKRDIIVGKDFRTYVKAPLIADDTMAYNIVWDLKKPCENSEFLITAFREDGKIITDSGTIDENGKAEYTLANNMYSIEGQTEVRLSILTYNTTLTDKILIFDVLCPNKINTILGNTDEQLINTLMAKFNEAMGKIDDIPTKTSELTNDSGFAYQENIPTKTSDLTNDSYFVADENYVHTDNNFTDSYKEKVEKAVTVEEIPAKTSDLENDSNFIDDITLFDSLRSALTNYVNDENYVHTDNNFDDTISTFCWDLCGYSGADPSNVATKTYVDEQLGVIENGSY